MIRPVNGVVYSREAFDHVVVRNLVSSASEPETPDVHNGTYTANAELAVADEAGVVVVCMVSYQMFAPNAETDTAKTAMRKMHADLCFMVVLYHKPPPKSFSKVHWILQLIFGVTMKHAKADNRGMVQFAE